VPNDKTAIIALQRAIVTTNTPNYVFGYADNASGTNFVGLANIEDLDLITNGSERYWVFNIPSGKFIGFKNVGATSINTLFSFVLVLFEV
jgi:hypothetical protein